MYYSKNSELKITLLLLSIIVNTYNVNIVKIALQDYSMFIHPKIKASDLRNNTGGAECTRVRFHVGTLLLAHTSYFTVMQLGLI